MAGADAEDGESRARGRPKKAADPNAGPRQRLAWALTRERERIAGKPTQRDLAEAAGLGLTSVQQAEDEDGRMSLRTVRMYLEGCWSMSKERGQAPVCDPAPFEELFYLARPEARPELGAGVPADPPAPRPRRVRTRAKLVGASAAALIVLTAITAAVLAGRAGWNRRGPAPDPAAITCTAPQPCSFQVEVGEDMCLDWATAFNRVEIWPCWNGKVQKWIAVQDGSRPLIRSQQAPDSCLSAAEPGRQLTIEACTGRGIRWTTTRNRDESYNLDSGAFGGTCLTDQGAGVALRTPVVLTPCQGRPEQRWIRLGGTGTN